jgi:hypothetical protein
MYWFNTEKFSVSQKYDNFSNTLISLCKLSGLEFYDPFRGIKRCPVLFFVWVLPWCFQTINAHSLVDIVHISELFQIYAFLIRKQLYKLKYVTSLRAESLKKTCLCLRQIKWKVGWLSFPYWLRIASYFYIFSMKLQIYHMNWRTRMPLKNA